ncbi:MAG: OpgC domain-containing protein [Rhodospirillales bacterium]|nr:OpgC domain-containing protein [Rhodospirillales bacterium]
MLQLNEPALAPLDPMQFILEMSVISTCGRHSLEVFAFGTLGSLLGRLFFRTFGTGWEMQAMVNGIGLAGMIAVALVLDRARTRRTVGADLRAPVQ